MEKQLSSLKSEYESIPVPQEALERVQSGIQKAKSESKIVPFISLKKSVAGIAAAFVVCAVAVNCSPSIAQAMESIPLIGKAFKVITVRKYQVDIENSSISANVPQIDEESGKAAATVNIASSDYIEEIMERFKKYCEKSGLEYASLEVAYSVMADTDDHFSLDICAEEISAGGYEFHRFYTIDKASDRIISLSDLFGSGEDYITPVSKEIIRQMRESGKDFFIADDEFDNEGFSIISPDQNFYLDKNDDLVICFDEYEVGAGSIGAPKFIISKELLADIKS